MCPVSITLVSEIFALLIFVSTTKVAITIGIHPSNKPAMRHVDMRVHMLRQHVELGRVSTPFCPTNDMVADYTTKAAPNPTHERHRARAMGDQDMTPALLAFYSTHP